MIKSRGPEELTDIESKATFGWGSLIFPFPGSYEHDLGLRCGRVKPWPERAREILRFPDPKLKRHKQAGWQKDDVLDEIRKR
jgi:hypothetical protein